MTLDLSIPLDRLARFTPTPEHPKCPHQWSRNDNAGVRRCVDCFKRLPRLKRRK